jgi:Na+-transporting methylmalonyl-CoA/oxaloacetate decarboxylase gamma subunit
MVMNNLSHIPIQLAQASVPLEAPTTGSVVIVGFLFVVIVLALLAAVTSAIGAFFIKSAARDAAKAAKAAEKAANASAQRSVTPSPSTDSGTGEPSATGDDPALLAVIAAAVHTMMGDRAHRVVSVRSAGPGWAQEGRRQIFSSHRVR